VSYQPELTERSPFLAVWAQAAPRWWIAPVVAFAFLIFVAEFLPFPGGPQLLLSAVVGVAVLLGSTRLGLYWLRNYFITSNVMLILFSAALIIPWLFWNGTSQLDEIDRWRYLIIALAAWTLYWIKHPAQHARAAAIGALIWIGFNVGVVIPGLGEHERVREEAFAIAVEQGDCVASEDESCSPTPMSMIAGAVILGYALNLATEGEFIRGLSGSRTRNREERGRDRDVNDDFDADEADDGGGA
jgi:hypothetical protein